MFLLSHATVEKMNRSGITLNYSALDANRDYFQTVLPFSVVLGILSTIGIFANIFILYVYAFKYPPCNFKYFVLVLGTIDFLSCCLTIPGEIYTQYTWFTMPSVGLCKAKSFFNAATVTCSSVVLLLISIDRFRKICCPHGWQIRPVHALRLSVSLSILAFVWSSPAIVLCGSQTYEMDYSGDNIHVTICLKDDTYKDTIWPSLIMKAIYVGPNIVIMVTTVVLYVFIAKVIFQRTDDKKPTRNASIMARLAREANMVNGTLEKSETWNDPSVVDSDFATLRNSIRDEQCKSNEVSNSVTPDDTVDRHVVNKLPSFQLQLSRQNERRIIRRSPKIKRKRLDSKHYVKVLRRRSYARVRRKTLIMFILTTFFVVSTSVYFFLASQMSDNGVFFKDMTLVQDIVVMFFFRFYYFNSLVNAVVYGVLDPRFRRAIRRASRRMSWSVTSLTSIMKR